MLCPDRLAESFEPLGDKCEFGIAQRYCGTEPLGLLRFASLPHAQLLHLLGSRFAELDDPGEIDVYLRPGDAEWWGRVGRFGIEYHTGRSSAEVDAAAAVRGERLRIGRLKQKLLEDLATPDKVFLRRDPGRTPAEMVVLLTALRAYAPHVLLWVDQAVRPDQAGVVERLRPGLARGFLGRFFADAAPDPAGLAEWLAVLSGALALLQPARHRALAAGRLPAEDAGLAELGWSAASDAATMPSTDVPAIAPGWPALRHRLGTGAVGRAVPVMQAESAAVASGGLYVASAQVWLPAGFAGWVGISFAGAAWVQMWAADPGRRDCWQMVATTLRAGSVKAVPGLYAAGPAGETFYSSGWRMQRGVIPGGGV